MSCVWNVTVSCICLACVFRVIWSYVWYMSHLESGPPDSLAVTSRYTGMLHTCTYIKGRHTPVPGAGPAPGTGARRSRFKPWPASRVLPVRAGHQIIRVRPTFKQVTTTPAAAVKVRRPASASVPGPPPSPAVGGDREYCQAAAAAAAAPGTVTMTVTTPGRALAACPGPAGPLAAECRPGLRPSRSRESDSVPGRGQPGGLTQAGRLG
jgi:hypothetical protein